MTSFKRNLIIGYSLSLLLLIISSVASYLSIRNLLYSQQLVNHTHTVIKKLDDVISVLKDAETGQRGFLLTGETDFLEPYNGAFDRVDKLINETKSLTADNSTVQESIEQLRELVAKRMVVLQTLLEQRKKGIAASIEDLRKGKYYMDQARKLVLQMQNHQQSLLNARTKELNTFATSTPALIIAASILSIIVTLVSFFKINEDFNKRVKLQKVLQEKDKELRERINIIQGIAEKISSGDYKTRVSDQGKDVLGELAYSLNKMAETLDHSFTSLSENEWLQTGVAGLNEVMIGERSLETLTYKTIDFITNYVKLPLGAFYLVDKEKSLTLSSGIAIDQSTAKKEVSFGDGLAGQSALSRKEIGIENVTETDFAIQSSAGLLKPKALLAFPVFYEGILKGVIEVGSLKNFTAIERSFFKTVSVNIGMAIHSARDYQRQQDLLAKTQAQSEELQSQHAELESINTELEAQAEKLQASEEELRVQQEELQEANQQLEERTRSLEEKNELILERNLDIQAKAEELELTTKYKSEFLANMSHELRTPLNSILLLSRLLSDNHSDNLTPEQIEYATVIQTSGKGLLTLIDEILDLSKIESGKMELEYSKVNVEEVARELKALFSPIAKDKGIEFVIDLQKDVNKTIETDKLRLDQVLRNLLSNALKFTKQGSVKLQITSINSTISFAVKDTGIGISKDKHETVFEAFKQADGSTQRRFGGTGLGLSISRELAKLLGGEITLQSEEGKGSIFTLTLPVVREIATAQPVKEKVAPVPAYKDERRAEKIENERYRVDIIPPSITDDRNDIKKHDKVILIIEDDTGFAKALLDFTRKRNYKGIVAVRGDEGIELAIKFRPLGILLDIQLPIKSGWEVMEELKSYPVTRSIPVHMMSSQEEKTKSLAKGAVDFINKPVAFEKLGNMFQQIEHALNSSPKKVLIVEENERHAQALANFLDSHNVGSEIKDSVEECIKVLQEDKADCVILNMGSSATASYEALAEVKKTKGLENIPIIVFTGKNLSPAEEMRVKQYADTIVIKTAHSYQRILDEVSLFLHLVEENKKDVGPKYKKMGEVREVLRGKTVLIADDDVRNIFSLTKSLESYGMNVLLATNGKEALKQLEENNKVHIVLMDMMMPEMDGYESTTRLRQMPKYRNLPVIAVTAKAMMGDREKCINAGASDYITKPVDIDQLISLLRVWLYE